jgi:glycosyltransferase involved in cell wall biosynthesis
MSAPTISVLMPVFNAERYVAAAVESVLVQTLGDFEFIIIDDGSTDRSPAILAEFARRDSRIRLLRQANTGHSVAMNEGLRLCRGEFVARMDADDISRPERFQQQVTFLRAHPECVLVGCGLLRIDADGDPLCEELLPETHEPIEERLLAGQGAICHPATMIRRQAMVRVGGYREAFHGAEDHDLWLRLGEIGRLANLPDVLFLSRIHQQNYAYVYESRSRRAVSLAVTEACARRGLPPRKDAETEPPPRRECDRMRAWTRGAIYAGNRRAARKHAWSIWRASWREVDSWLLLGHALLGHGAAARLGHRAAARLRGCCRRLRGR